VTRVGPLPGVPFEVNGLSLRYRSPFSAFVDELEPVADRFYGRATFSRTRVRSICDATDHRSALKAVHHRRDVRRWRDAVARLHARCSGPA
jgi:hypothetical protein